MRTSRGGSFTVAPLFGIETAGYACAHESSALRCGEKSARSELRTIEHLEYISLTRSCFCPFDHQVAGSLRQFLRAPDKNPPGRLQRSLGLYHRSRAPELRRIHRCGERT